MKNPKPNTEAQQHAENAERRDRARLILARLSSDVAELALLLATDAPLVMIQGSEIADLGEYAGMLEDALNGRQPYDKGSRTKKVRKAFGYGHP